MIRVGLLSVLLFGSIACVAMEPMSEEEKQQSLQNLKSYIELDKLATTSSTESLQRIQPLFFEERQKRRDYLKGEKYLIKVYFRNDVNFPIKYGGADSFVKNESPDFYEKMSEMIPAHYLGSSHQKYFATLVAVNSQNEVSIELEIENASELNELLVDDRILDILHIADGNVETIVLPATTK